MVDLPASSSKFTYSMTRNGSFHLRSENVKIVSSNTGSSSPYAQKQPVHVVTIYTSPDTTTNRISQSGRSILNRHSLHIPELHLKPQDAEPATFRPHRHLKTEDQEGVLDIVQAYQAHGIIGNELDGFEAIGKEAITTRDAPKAKNSDTKD